MHGRPGYKKHFHHGFALGSHPELADPLHNQVRVQGSAGYPDSRWLTRNPPQKVSRETERPVDSLLLGLGLPCNRRASLASVSPSGVFVEVRLLRLQ